MAILLISPEPWQAHTVSKHHYALTLSRQGHRVLFLEPPETQLRQLKLESVPGHPRLQRVHSPRVAFGIRWMPSLLRCWLEHRWLCLLERRACCRIEVIWLFENSRFYDLRFAGKRLKIYHQVDLNQNFHPAIAARTADICFCTSERIRERLITHNPCCYFIHHGFAPVHTLSPLKQEHQSHFSHSHLNAVYVGNLEMPYLDLQLLGAVITAHPHVRFHLVGGYLQGSNIRVQLANLSNVVWWGKVKSASIPAILDSADVLLVCYKADHHIDQANPHKLMEYMASGRTVVATYTEEYAYCNHLLAMSDPGDNAMYPELFASVLERLNESNSPEQLRLRQDFAANHTYLKQLERIESFLQLHGFSLSSYL